MAILNITYNGLSVDYPRPVDERMTDDDIRRTAVEVIRGGELPGLHIAQLSASTFADFIVDRLKTPEGKERIYLRPKVPFGA